VIGGEVEFAGATPISHVAFGGGGPRLGTIGGRLDREIGTRRAYDMVGNVAIIAIEGSLVHKGAWLESESGETSYQGIQTQVSRARRDPNVKGVCFEIDCYGGESSGAFETADMVFALSREKPSIAILSDVAYSGGYLLAAAARQVIVPEQGGCGSIGAVTMHIDVSRALEAMGEKVTIIAAGAHKADFNPFEALPEDVAAKVKGELESIRASFAAAVSKYRGPRFSFDDAMATEADCYSGAEAVTRGLADATGYPSDAFEAFVTSLNRA
jgi:ClpP class serine protease